MANIWEQSPSSKYGLYRGSQQDTMLREAEKPFLPGGGYNQDTFPTPFADFQAEVDYNATPGAKTKQRLQGGVDPAGAATTGPAVNTGSGDPVKLGDPTKITANTTQAEIRGPTTYTSPFDQSVTHSPNASVTTLSGSKVPLSYVNEDREIRSPGGSTRIGSRDQGPNSFNESNTNPRPSGGGAFSTYTPPDYEAGIAALKDLREAKIEAAGGRGNRGTGPTVEEYNKPNYARDLEDYNSGQVGSMGYTRIANEKMAMENAIDNLPRGVAKGPLIESMLNNYGKSQEARLGLDAEDLKNKTEMDKAAMAGMSENAKLALAQQKEMFGQQDANRKFGLEQNRFGLDVDKANADRQYKSGQLGVDLEKLSQSWTDMDLKAGDYASQAEKRKADIMLGQTEGLRKAFETGLKPGENMALILQQEGGMSKLPPNARVSALIANGYPLEQIQKIDPEGYAAYMQQQQAGQ